MLRMIKIFLFTVSPFLLILYSYDLFVFLTDNYKVMFTDIYYRFFWLGCGVSLLSWIFFMSGWDFLHTLEHELTHMITGLLFFEGTSELNVTDGAGGHVMMTGTNFFTTLSPYFFPTFPLLIFPLYFVLMISMLPYFFAVSGFLLVYHLMTSIQEFGYYQSDIQKSGKVFSSIFVPMMNIMFWGMYVFFIGKGFSGVWRFLKFPFSFIFRLL